jgi:hypothetical protein
VRCAGGVAKDQCSLNLANIAPATMKRDQPQRTSRDPARRRSFEFVERPMTPAPRARSAMPARARDARPRRGTRSAP